MVTISMQTGNLAGTIKADGGLSGSIWTTAQLSGSLHHPEFVEKVENTFILVDDYGNEAVAVFADETVTLDATANDIRINKKAATGNGVTVGTKVIPAYYVSEGQQLIPNGNECIIPFGDRLYNFTKLQVIICPFAGSMSASVATEKVSINGKMYNAGSDTVLSTVTKDSETQSINLGITNESGTMYLIRYFGYMEEE